MEFIEPYMNYIIIAAVVIAALILLTVISRALNSRVRGRRGKRLGVSEYRELDQTRRLMLVRRDDVEHLILVGGGQSLVIEQNIYPHDEDGYASPPVAHHREAPQMTETKEPDFAPEPAHNPAPRAPAFGDRAPNIRPVHREPALPEPRRFERDEGY